MLQEYEAIDVALEKLHILTGKDYLLKLREITNMKVFKELENHKNIFYTGGRSEEDLNNLLEAAEKAVRLGYTVYILPNPATTRSGDLILLRNRYIRLYELKTIIGKNSVDNRLKDSIGQSNSVLLNIASVINHYRLAKAIKDYFYYNSTAQRVLVFKNRREILIKRQSIKSDFEKKFRGLWYKNK